MIDEMPNCPTVPGCPCYGDDKSCHCVCGLSEKALRAWRRYDGKTPSIPPMTPEQREWCYQEIDAVECHDREDYLTASDAELAYGVLCAWQDYCRDEGLL